jgi:predicted PurR-regulated permease PerM
MDPVATELTNQLINSPIVQYGALGLCFILAGIIFYLIKKLFLIIDNFNNSMQENTKIIAKNTEVLDNVLKKLQRFEDNNNDLLKELLKKPCLASKG